MSIIQGVIGGAQIVGGVSAGWLSDRIGLTAVACVAAAAHILAYIGTYVNILSGMLLGEGFPLSLYVLLALLGRLDGAFRGVYGRHCWLFGHW